MRLSARPVLLCLLLGCQTVWGITPQFEVHSSNVTVIEGDTAILPCSVRFLGEKQVAWTHGPMDRILTVNQDRHPSANERYSVSSNYEKEWNLKIASVRYNDQGRYKCQVSTVPVISKTVILNVQVPPSIILERSSDKKVASREGETVELICDVKGMPRPSVSWYRSQDHPASKREKLPVSGEKLFLPNVTRNCGSYYECRADNGVGSAVSHTMQVSIEFRPEVHLDNAAMGQMLGFDTILQCQYRANPKPGHVFWRNQMKQEVIHDARHQISTRRDATGYYTLEMHISSLEEDDFGLYTCVVRNTLGSEESTMQLYKVETSSSTRKTPAPSNRPPGYVKDSTDSAAVLGANTALRITVAVLLFWLL